MDTLYNFFTFSRMFQAGAIVFSFLFVVLTIQMWANISSVVKTVRTRRNTGFAAISFALVAISVLLFILGFVIL